MSRLSRIDSDEIEALQVKNLDRSDPNDTAEARETNYEAAVKAVQGAERPEAVAAILLARLNPRVGGPES